MTLIKKKLAKSCVGIAGCGGLGSNCAMALARVGVGKLVIVDFDAVQESNLNRQYYFRDQLGQKKVAALRENIRRIDPGIRVEAHDLKLDAAGVTRVFAPCRVIVEAFDQAEMKRMLIETVLDEMPEKFVVAGSGLAGWGQNNALHTRRSGNLFICGDESREVSNALPPLAPRVGIVANLQANQVLEILLGEPTTHKKNK